MCSWMGKLFPAICATRMPRLLRGSASSSIRDMAERVRLQLAVGKFNRPNRLLLRML